MSLIKAFKNTNSVRTFAPIMTDFKMALEAAMMDDKMTAEDVALLTSYYAEYSVSYLTYVATSLTEPKDASQTMKFMNSYIAETCNAAGLHYFHMEGTFSIVDKAVQGALDNGGTISTEAVKAIIAEIEESYVEDEIPEEE